MIGILNIVPTLLEFACICVFLIKLKYVRESGLALFGVYQLLDLTFTLIAFIVPLLLSTVSFNTSIMLFTNILLIFQMGLILLIIKRFEVVQSNSILGIIFGIFIMIWFIEFYNKGISDNVVLYYAEIFSKVTTVCLSWFYLFGIFKKMPTNYREEPFLFVVIGWLLYSITFIFFDNPELIKCIDDDATWVKGFLLVATAITQSIAVIFYIIAFFKAEKWVQQNLR